MDDKNDMDKLDDVMLPGFRFHPTDEELVGFYLKRKLQQKALPIELIKQVDIYKYDPWDLPKLASTGEKEWYFYCPRDRKYRNSARPNRVTGSGFWKATGTDRPIYSSDGSKCIGLKKSLVFYRGRAAKGMKTDWMMHEFRLPTTSDTPATHSKKLLDKNFPANDSWAICRIFKKTSSMAQRALSHSWVSSLSDQTSSPDAFTQAPHYPQLTLDNGPNIQLCTGNDLLHASSASFSAFNIPSYKPLNQMSHKPSAFTSSNLDFMFSPQDDVLGLGPNHKGTLDFSSMLFNLSPTIISDVTKSSECIDFEGQEQQLNSFTMSSSQEISLEDDEEGLKKNRADYHQWTNNVRSIGFPFSLPSTMPSNMTWDSPPCPSEMSSTYSTNKSYT